METNSKNPYDAAALRREILILLLCVILVVGAGYIAYLKFTAGPEYVSSVVQDNSQGKIDGVPAKELKGVVVTVSQDKTYFRLAVATNEVYSIGLEDNSGDFLAAVNRAPGSPMTVVVTGERSGSLYDFKLRGFSVDQQPKTVEERMDRMRATGGKIANDTL